MKSEYYRISEIMEQATKRYLNTHYDHTPISRSLEYIEGTIKDLEIELMNRNGDNAIFDTCKNTVVNVLRIFSIVKHNIPYTAIKGEIASAFTDTVKNYMAHYNSEGLQSVNIPEYMNEIKNTIGNMRNNLMSRNIDETVNNLLTIVCALAHIVDKAEHITEYTTEYGFNHYELYDNLDDTKHNIFELEDFWEWMAKEGYGAKIGNDKYTITHNTHPTNDNLVSYMIKYLFEKSPADADEIFEDMVQWSVVESMDDLFETLQIAIRELKE